MANHSSPEYHVLPTRVRLYHRRGSGKSHPPPQPSQLRKTSTPADFTDMAFLVKTSSNGPELQFRSVSDADPRSPTPTGSSWNNVATDVTFDLSTIRSCEFYKCKEWVVITDSAGLCRAVEFVKDDPSSESFQERLISCTKLLKVKCSMKDTFDREKWLPTSPPPPSRQLPPVPNDRPNFGHSVNSTHSTKYDYCETIDRRRNVPEDWPDRPAPPPPTHPTLQRDRAIPPIGGNRRSPDYLDIFHNSVISVDEEDPMIPFSGTTADDGTYLLPCDQRLRYENDPSRRGPQQQPAKNCVPQSKVSTFGAPEWNCSACSVWNLSTNRVCNSCREPRASYAEQRRGCTKEKDKANKSAPWIKTKFEDCEECQRPNRRDSKECNECGKKPVAKSPGENGIANASSPPAISSKVKGTSLPDGRSKGSEGIHRRGSLDCTECERLKFEAPLTQHKNSNTRPQIEPKKKFEDCEQCQQNSPAFECDECGKRPDPKKPVKNVNPTPSSSPSCTQCTTLILEAPPTPYKPYKPPRIVKPFKDVKGCQMSPAVSSNVDMWRCKKCTVINDADTFFCKTCEAVRDDAWQCQVCRAVISLDVAQCRRCDVWKCHLCTFQNDDREHRSKLCKQCNQPR